MILLISEALILILVVDGIFTFASWQERLEHEAEAADLLEDMEFASYNALFDLCWHLKSNMAGRTLEEARDEALNLTTQWCETLSGWKSAILPDTRMVARVDPIQVEAFSGQSLDSFQMKYIGEVERGWFISGTLVVEFWKEGLLLRATYEVRIAV